MYVYVKHEGAIRRICDVTLHEYSVPKCGGRSEDRLDPALWFKVLVLDSVLVECDRRNVYWNRDVPNEKDDIHGYKENQLSGDLVWDFFQNKARLFESDDSAEYDPTYEDLFLTAKQLYHHIDTEQCCRETLDTMFKLFHMFILPQVVFRTEDRNKVECTLHSLEEYHITHVVKIEKTLISENNTERSLKEQTKDLLGKEEQFSKQSYIASCDREFLIVFQEQLDKFIDHGRLAIAGYTEKAEPLRKSKNKDDKALLKQLREEKDLLNDNFKKAMMIREEIRSHVGKTVAARENIRHYSFAFQMAYLKTYRGLQMIRGELHRLIKAKIKISAVREAILLSLNEIDTDGFSYGYYRIKGSFEAASDIVEMNSVPDEWTTLPAKVYTCIDKTDPTLKNMHEEFCEMIKLLCGQLMREMKGNVKTGTTKRSSFVNCCDNTYSSRWSIGSMSRDSCESICDKINHHITDFATTITAHLIDDHSGNPRDLQNRIHMCYGERVFVDLLPTLCELYEENYRELVQDLHRWLGNISATSLCGGQINVLKTIEKIQNNEPSYDSIDCSYDMPTQCPAKYKDTEYDLSHISYIGSNLDSDWLSNKSTDSEQDHSRWTSTGLSADVHADSLSNKNTDTEQEHSNSRNTGLSSDIGCLSNKNTDSGQDHTNSTNTFSTSDEECLSIESIDTEHEQDHSKSSFSTLNVNSLLTKPTDSVQDNLNTPNTDSTSDVDKSTSEVEPIYARPITIAGTSRSATTKLSRRKRFGVSITREQADEILDILPSTLPPIPDESSEYVDMNSVRISKLNLENLYGRFDKFIPLVKDITKEGTISGKRRSMAGLLRYIQNVLASLKGMADEDDPVTADDLVDVIILLLCNLEYQDLHKLYAHINLLNQLCPSFMSGSLHAYAVANINASYFHLFEQAKHRCPKV